MTGKRKLGLLSTLSFIALFSSSGVQAAEGIDAAKLYHDYCSVCHGDKGDGKSRAAGSMNPPPRDLTSAQAGIDLTRERMIKSIAEGRPGTAMAAWNNQLSSEQIAALADYIRNNLMAPVYTSDADEGRRIYAEYCSVCHGDKGDGRSRAAGSFFPPPRDFTTEEAKEKLNRDRMIFSVSYGRANTAMAGWETQLSKEQIEQVVDYVRARFMGLDPNEPKESKETRADMTLPYVDNLVGNVKNGEALYRFNCVPCHGDNGDGKGPRAYFILPTPRDFRHPAAVNSLNRPHLYEAIAKGTLGSEMPAWEKVMTRQEMVDISEYVFETFIHEGEKAPAADSSKEGHGGHDHAHMH